METSDLIKINLISIVIIQPIVFIDNREFCEKLNSNHVLMYKVILCL